MFSTITWGSVGGGITAVIAVASFIVGGIVRPHTRGERERRVIANELAIKTAARDAVIDERLNHLLTVSEAAERRLSSLEREVWQRRASDQ